MYKVIRNRLKLKKKSYNILKDMSKYSKNLYNYTLYTVRQYFLQNNKYIKYEKAYHLVNSNENYKELPSQVAQQTMKVVDRNFKSFFRVLQERKKGNYNRPVRIPKYLDKEEYFTLIFTPAHFSINDDMITLTAKGLLDKYRLGKLTIPFPNKILKDKKIKEIRILPICRANWFDIEFVYLDNTNYKQVEKNKNVLSIDLGVNNLITFTDNVTNKAHIISGKKLKSVNRYFNKKIGYLQSILNKSNLKFSKQIYRLRIKRDNYINDLFHKISKKLIDYCIKYNISSIVCGYNKEWKRNVNIGRINNQNFIYIPFGKLMQNLEYKCENYGIEFITITEEYTSKCDSLNLETIEKHDKYLGNRIKRGLFQSSKNLINADVNSSINILRKCKGDTFVKKLVNSGFMLNPIKIRDFQTLNKAF